MTEEIQVKSAGILSVEDVKQQINQIQYLMKSVMVTGMHYGVIPGCGDKPTLLKAGAEKISFMFKMAPSYYMETIDMGNGHREYRITCTLTHIPSGLVMGQGVGSCSTMESKYKFRWDSTGQPVPKEYWNTRDKELLGGEQYVARKSGGAWEIYQRVEHDNPADYYNTCLKMGKKRAQVDGTLTAAGASDIFTQDIEDMKENNETQSGKEAPKEKKWSKEPETKTNGDKYPPKEVPTDKQYEDFQTELLASCGDADSVEVWLSDQTKSFKEIHSVREITSVKWLNRLKGALRKEAKGDQKGMFPNA